MHVDPVALSVQLMMAMSLAACAGLRAWLPLLVLGGLSRFELVPLGESFHFVSSTPALVVFGVATIVELLADKIIAVDHALDAVSTFIRPIAGTVLAAAALSSVDPLLATVAGIVVGGGTALTVHAGKAAVRAKTSTLAPTHGGLGNTFVSLIEDVVALIGAPLAVLAPILAFLFACAMLVAAFFFVRWFLRTGRRAIQLLFASKSEPR